MVESIAELRRICHNAARFTDRPWWYRLYRTISIHVTKAILSTGIFVNPNYVTLLEVICEITGALLLLSNNLFVVLFGFFLLFIAYMWDCVDGELARYYKKFSSAGSYLDEVGHAIIDPLIFVVLSLIIYRNNASFLVILMGFLTSFLIRFVKTNYQLNSFIFVKEVTSSPQVFKEAELPKDSETSKSLFTSIMSLTNSLKHYVIILFFFLATYLLDFYKAKISVIPFVEYKLIMLIFYSVFLSLVALAQIVVNLRSIDKEKLRQYKAVKEALEK